MSFKFLNVSLRDNPVLYKGKKGVADVRAGIKYPT